MEPADNHKTKCCGSWVEMVEQPSGSVSAVGLCPEHESPKTGTDSAVSQAVLAEGAKRNSGELSEVVSDSSRETQVCYTEPNSVSASFGKNNVPRRILVSSNFGPKGTEKKLSKAQQKMHKEYQNHLASDDQSILKGFFGDNQPSAGVTELRFNLVDWIERPLAPITAGKPVYNYYLDVGRPFFADAATTADVQYTRTKVRRVKLWFLSPARTVDDTPLLQVLTAIPVKDQATGNAFSLLGQSNTIIHPDVRQPWVMVGNWNWESIFENSQYQPFEYPGSPVPDSRDLLAIFTFLVINATSGAPFTDTATGDVSLKVELELQTPIPLVPTPLRMEAIAADFTTPPSASDVAVDRTPVQYSLKSIHNQM